ncbi:uncharacterized protein [Leptinotarsa decemlineata]|uniref:uncharacterized protein n=1 Tax=Leptinotarsa decemlineata TaxID=7539 RepID=UPI003D308B93
MIAYGSVVWWPKTQQAGAIRRLSGIQRQACLAATGAMRTTPTASLEVLLNLTPLHLYIQGEARSVISRLTRGQMPISMLHGKRYNELNKELENDPIMGMPSDDMLPQYSFGKNFKTIITGRGAWKGGPPINTEVACYTDGSKTEEGVGAGIYITKPKTEVSLSLGKKVTIIQTETAAIHHCAEELLRQEFKGKTIAIYSDSQAAIKAISSMQVNSKLV